uniref:Family with sequence similarity 83 member H n=1 Tax=Latimeria chalumnae TaxID=7897 RepID=H3AY05_LATCH
FPSRSPCALCPAMARRSQSSSQGDNPFDPNYLEPHYKEWYRLAIDALAEEGVDSYYHFLSKENLPEFLCSTEIEHINKHLCKPHLTSQEPAYSDPSFVEYESDSGSSGTYWPMHSDIAAPELDLGWPMNYIFTGPSDVTTLVHPASMDSIGIKEQARRLIKAAQKVIAVAMDIFTDIDLFKDLLDATARRIPVYIVLDELYSHYFVEMVSKCKVNLAYRQFMRVRMVPGPTYYCRTGMSFKGHMTEKFMLVDCKAVLCGSYSFMWSFEKIHRSIAHIFHGELVATFDEEFRILFAQSNPLVPVEDPSAKEDNYYAMMPYGMARKPYERNQMLYASQEDLLMHQRMSYSHSDRMDRERAFRRDDALRHTLEGRFVQMHTRQLERSQFEPSRALYRSKGLETDSYKRHSFAEGTMETYSHSRRFMKQRLLDNMEELEAQTGNLQRDDPYQVEHQYNPNRLNTKLFDKFRGNKFGYSDMENIGEDPRYLLDAEPDFPTSTSPMLNYVPSNSSKEVRHGSGHLEVSGDGRMGPKSPKRQNIGQTYACQKSPTQKHLDQKLLFEEQGLTQRSHDSNKTGMRRWRISSYLSKFQNETEEGLPLSVESEAFEDTHQPPEQTSREPLTRFAKDLPQIPPFRPKESFYLKRLDKEFQSQENLGPKQIFSRIPRDSSPAPSFTSTECINEQAPSTDNESDEPREGILTRQDIRLRLNPILQRSSRLRSSLIFSSSKREQHTSAALNDKKGLDPNQPTTDEDKKKSDKPVAGTVAELLLKYRSMGKDLGKPEVGGLNRSQVSLKSTIKEEPASSLSKNVEEAETKKDEGSRSSFLMAALSRASTSQKEISKPEAVSATISQAPQALNKGASANVVSKSEKTTTEPKSDELKLGRKVSEADGKKTTVESSQKEASAPGKKESLPTPPTPQPTKPNITVTAQVINITAATESQKQTGIEAQKSRSRPSSASNLGSSMESLSKTYGSSTSLNVCEGGDAKDPGAFELIRMGSLKIKQFFNQKAEKRAEEPATAALSQSQATENQTVKQQSETPGSAKPSKSESHEVAAAAAAKVEEKEEKPHKPASAKTNPPSQNRLPASTSNIIFSSNLRDDTKVILEQISANSQKNRGEMAKQAPLASTNSVDNAKGKEKEGSEKKNEEKPSKPVSRTDSFLSWNKYSKPQSSPDDRETLIKRMDSIRKEKRVYSRFEVFYQKNKKNSERGEDNSQAEKDSKKSGNILPKLLGTFRNK